MGSHDAVVAAVYEGECDAGGTYVDARGVVEDEYPDVMEEVVVVDVSVDVPNDGVQFIPTMDDALKNQIVDAFLVIAETEAGREALDAAYAWDGLEKHGDAFYDPFRQVLQDAVISVEDLQ
jgi:phosphonate transport system substrate-binding protein